MEIKVLNSSKEEIEVQLGNLTMAEILRVYLNIQKILNSILSKN